MVLIKIALFILLITLTFYLSEKIMWIVYFLFNFRIWHLFFEKVNVEIYNNFTKNEKIFALLILSLITYLIIYSIIMKIAFAPLKYIYLGVLMLIIFSNYSVSELLFFQDFFDVEKVEITKESVEKVVESEDKLGWATKLGIYIKGYVVYVVELVDKFMPS